MLQYFGKRTFPDIIGIFPNASIFAKMFGALLSVLERIIFFIISNKIDLKYPVGKSD